MAAHRAIHPVKEGSHAQALSVPGGGARRPRHDRRLIFGPGGRANTGEPALVITNGIAKVTFDGPVATSFRLVGRQANICATLAAR